MQRAVQRTSTREGEEEEGDDETLQEEEMEEEEAEAEEDDAPVTATGGKRGIKWIRGALIGAGSFGSVYLGIDSRPAAISGRYSDWKHSTMR